MFNHQMSREVPWCGFSWVPNPSCAGRDPLVIPKLLSVQLAIESTWPNLPQSWQNSSRTSLLYTLIFPKPATISCILQLEIVKVLYNTNVLESTDRRILKFMWGHPIFWNAGKRTCPGGRINSPTLDVYHAFQVGHWMKTPRLLYKLLIWILNLLKHLIFAFPAIKKAYTNIMNVARQAYIHTSFDEWVNIPIFCKPFVSWAKFGLRRR